MHSHTFCYSSSGLQRLHLLKPYLTFWLLSWRHSFFQLIYYFHFEDCNQSFYSHPIPFTSSDSFNVPRDDKSLHPKDISPEPHVDMATLFKAELLICLIKLNSFFFLIFPMVLSGNMISYSSQNSGNFPLLLFLPHLQHPKETWIQQIPFLNTYTACISTATSLVWNTITSQSGTLYYWITSHIAFLPSLLLAFNLFFTLHSDIQNGNPII